MHKLVYIYICIIFYQDLNFYKYAYYLIIHHDSLKYIAYQQDIKQTFILLYYILLHQDT